ncbi:hypothetical protein BJX76DRAFT_335882 [Aspergillus varians]
MDTPWQNGTISECANICLESFNGCLAHFGLLLPREQSAIEDQLGRFSIWAHNIGVFAPTRGSLDYRLRDASDIQRLMRRLLRTLNDHVQRYVSHLSLIRAAGESMSGAATPATGVLDSLINDMADEITLMHQLSNTIRKASREGQNIKAATAFVIRDEDGNDIDQVFMDLFALGIIQRRFPGCNEAIQKRLAAAMLLRRKRILYRRSRHWKSLPQVSSAPKKAIPSLEGGDVGNLAEISLPQQPAPTVALTRRTTGSEAATATTLNMDNWKRASTPSIISRPNTIHWSHHEDVDFPPAPLGPIRRRLKALKDRHVAEYYHRLNELPNHLVSSSEDFYSITSQLQDDLDSKVESDRLACNSGNMEVACPYCCCSLSSSIVTNMIKWIDHVKYDLDPYVCLFDTCDGPHELYNHSEDWLNHMRQHNLRWRCGAKSHGVLVFHARDEYEEHMRTSHKSTKSQLTILAERSSRSSGPLFQFCPLCGQSPDTGLEDHVASHLRYLALKSLPFTDDQEEGSLGELASDFESTGRVTRSTIIDDYNSSSSSIKDQAMDNIEAQPVLPLVPGEHPAAQPSSRGRSSESPLAGDSELMPPSNYSGWEFMNMPPNGSTGPELDALLSAHSLGPQSLENEFNGDTMDLDNKSNPVLMEASFSDGMALDEGTIVGWEYTASYDNHCPYPGLID